MLRFENGIIVECSLPFVIDLIPKENKTSRPQLKLDPTSITVHNFGDDQKPKAERVTEFVDNAFDKFVSWHFTIGYYNGILTVIQELPIDEVAWAAGDGVDGPGNRTSLHIECEENEESEEFMIKFIRLLIDALKIKSVFPHKHWSGKDCPRMILTHWNEFIAKIRGEDIMTKKEIQRALKTTGDYHGAIDGDFGPMSKAAVEQFQERRGLVVDGSPGPATQAELKKAIAEMSSSDGQISRDEFEILKRKVAAIEKKF